MHNEAKDFNIQEYMEICELVRNDLPVEEFAKEDRRDIERFIKEAQNDKPMSEM